MMVGGQSMTAAPQSAATRAPGDRPEAKLAPAKSDHSSPKGKNALASAATVGLRAPSAPKLATGGGGPLFGGAAGGAAGGREIPPAKRGENRRGRGPPHPAGR